MSDTKMTGAEFKAKFGEVFFIKEEELQMSDPSTYTAYMYKYSMTCKNDDNSKDFLQKEYKKDHRLKPILTVDRMSSIGLDVSNDSKKMMNLMFSCFKETKEIFPKDKLIELLKHGKGYVSWGSNEKYTVARVIVPNDAEITIDCLGMKSDRLEYIDDSIYFDDYLLFSEIIEICNSLSDPKYIFDNIRKSDEIILGILTVKGTMLEYVEQNWERCLAAVSQDGDCLAMVKDKTDEIEIAACKSRHGFRPIKYVRVQTRELIKFYFENNSFPSLSDIKDENILDSELVINLITKHPGRVSDLPQKYQTNDMWKISLAERPDFIHYNKNQNEELVLFAFATGKLKDKQALAYCHIQTPKIILEAVKVDHNNLAIIKHPRIIYKAPERDSGRYPTREVTQEANFEGSDIKIEDIIMLALEKNGSLIDNIIDPTKEMRLLAVNTYSSDRKYQHMQGRYETERLADQYSERDIINTFFSFNGEELDDDYIKEIIKSRPGYISILAKTKKYDHILQELKLIAIQNGHDPYWYSIPNDIDREELKALITYDGERIKNCKEQNEELCLIAVKQNGKALKHVKEQTEAIVLAAVAQNDEAKKYVKFQFWKLFV